MFEKQIRIPEPEEIKDMVPIPESLKKIKAEHPEKLIVMWTVRTADNYKTALDTADNIIFECNDKNADYISTDKARSFLADKTE